MNTILWISVLSAIWVWILIFWIKTPKISKKELENHYEELESHWEKRVELPRTMWERVLQFTKEHQMMTQQLAELLRLSEEKTNLLIYQANSNKQAKDIIHQRVVILLSGIFITFLLIAMASDPIFGVIGAGLTFYAYLYPEMALRTQVKKRQENIQRMLPDVMEVFAVLQETGASPLEALLHISENFTGPISDEFQKVYQRAQYNGFNWVAALLESADLMQVEELQDMSNAIAISVQKGTPLSFMIREQVDRMRFYSQQKLEERAAKASTKIMFVTMVFVLVPMIALLVSPSMTKMDVDPATEMQQEK